MNLKAMLSVPAATAGAFHSCKVHLLAPSVFFPCGHSPNSAAVFRVFMYLFNQQSCVSLLIMHGFKLDLSLPYFQESYFAFLSSLRLKIYSSQEFWQPSAFTTVKKKKI